MKTYLKKSEYHFLVEITPIENAIYPYKTALSKISEEFFRNEIVKSTNLVF